MTDPEILAELQAGNSESLVEAYGDSLFRYCWFLLRSRDASEIAVRDAFVVAAAYAGRLRDPEWFRPWLYALARAECHRRRPVPAAAADEPPARPSQPDADSRVVAWNAVTSMPPLPGEALELAVRHQLSAAGIALALGVPDAESLLETARDELSQSVAAHLIVRRTGFDCAGLTAALRGWAGTMTAEIRDRVLTHAADCASCGRHRPRGVSAARVFGLLPDPRPVAGTRDVVLSRLTDPRHGGYRGFVAGRAAGSAPIAALAASAGTSAATSDLTATAPLARVTGPAADAGSARPGRRTAVARRVPVTRGRLIAGLLAASVAVAAGALLVLAGFPRAQVLTPSASGTASSPGAVSPGSSSGAQSRIGAVGAEPVGARGSATAAPPLVVAFPGSNGQALYLAASQQPSTPAPSRTGRRRQRPSAPPPSTGAASPAPSSSPAAPSSEPSSSAPSSSPSSSGSDSPAPGTSSPSATGSAS